ncbi:MAG: TIGR03364 family FAD-dependent oxidoreductase [Anaerolineae bacterium]
MDVIVVGAGIVGLAHAYAAARRGFKVALFERTERAVGASIRNFGQIWPVGKYGKLFQRALKSREIWLEICRSAGLWCRENGSLHLAYAADEMAVLEELFRCFPEARDYCQLLTPDEVAGKSQAVNFDGLQGALWSSTELNVDPRQAIREIPTWLADTYGVELHFGTLVNAISFPDVITSAGTWQAERVFVCSGADFETLYPQEFAASGILRCKLQMMRTVPQPDGWQLGPHLCGGLTLARYDSFADCPSLPALRQRYERELPFYMEQDIHVLLAQTARGELTIGDHHEYGMVFDPFDREDINQAILDYLRRFAQAPTFEIGERWHGIYPLIKGKTELVLTPQPGVTIVNALSGAGMTLSFGLADELLA